MKIENIWKNVNNLKKKLDGILFIVAKNLNQHCILFTVKSTSVNSFFLIKFQVTFLFEENYII